jgi:uncharacterized membrane protein
MANYFIIGGDGRQYGPITADDIRKWIAEGRLNAESSAKPESDAEWRPLAKFPEFADLFGLVADPERPSAVPLAPADWQAQDYELDLGGCFTRSWELYTKNFGVLFAGVLIYMLIEMFFSFLGQIPLIGPVFSLGNLIIIGPLMGGLYYQYILVNRGEKTAVGDIFAGFRRRFVHLMMYHLLVTFISLLCFSPVFIMYGPKFLPLYHQMQAASGDQAAAMEAVKNLLSLMFATVPWALVCAIPLTYISVSLIFTMPLIIDKDMDFMAAMGTSWRMVSKHWWLVFGLTILVGLVSMIGLICCCIGVPIGYAALMCAYETIFCQSKKD